MNLRAPRHLLRHVYPGIKKNLLWLEFIVLYLIFPLIYACNRESSPGVYLVVLSLIGFIILFKDNEFSNKIFFNRNALLSDFPRIAAIFLFVTALLLLLTYTFYPEYLFFCIKNHFSIWCSLMVYYPLILVYPQELLYRAFIFHRYSPLFSSEKSVMHLSAAAFSFGHIIYFHPVSMILTFFGGYLFAYTYAKTKSLLVVSIEHALYGCLLYTIGLGRFFYTGFEKLLN